MTNHRFGLVGLFCLVALPSLSANLITSWEIKAEDGSTFTFDFDQDVKPEFNYPNQTLWNYSDALSNIAFAWNGLIYNFPSASLTVGKPSHYGSWASALQLTEDASALVGLTFLPYGDAYGPDGAFLPVTPGYVAANYGIPGVVVPSAIYVTQPGQPFFPGSPVTSIQQIVPVPEPAVPLSVITIAFVGMIVLRRKLAVSEDAARTLVKSG